MERITTTCMKYANSSSSHTIRVVDLGAVDPYPTSEKNPDPDPDPTFNKNPGPYPIIEKQPVPVRIRSNFDPKKFTLNYFLLIKNSI